MTKKQTPMPPEVRKRCLHLKTKSKAGEYISEQDRKFLVRCWKRWNEEYKKIELEAHELARPDRGFRQ